jgi:hypothetical protein
MCNGFIAVTSLGYLKYNENVTSLQKVTQLRNLVTE